MRMKAKRIIAMPLIIILMLTSCLYIYPQQVEAKESSIYQGEGYEVTFCLDSLYDGGYNARLELTNKSSQTIEDWTLVFSFGENISDAWNGMLSKLEDGTYQIQNAGWNQDIRAGETVTFGFSGSCTQTPNAPTGYKLVGAQCTAAPNEYDVTCDLIEQWSSGYVVRVNITNRTAFTMKDWMLEFTSQNTLESVWGASITAHSDRTYQVRNNNDNQNISSYGTVSFDCMVTSSTYIEPCNFQLFYQSLDGTLVESLAPITSSAVEEPITSEAPITSEIPSETEEPEEEMDMTDTDGDGLIDVLEELIGTNLLMKDTDGDLLTDYEEVYLVGTDPLLIDSNGNGILDASDDIDLDGLANKDELDIGTSAANGDTDYDGLNDGEEVKQYGTDPLNEDTDGDTITDGDEVLLGLNPLFSDSDGDGIADNEEKIEQTFATDIEEQEKPEVTNVEVAFAGTGNIQNTTEIESVYGEDVYSSELIGLVGVPIEIETESEFDKATITFSYEESKLGEVKEEDLAIMWYDEENYDYVMMDSIVDKENNTVSCDTTHFSVYTLINKKAWKKFWSVPIQYHYLNYMDIAVVCENTREMYDLSDVTTMIGTNVASNITMLDHICEIEYGKDACVEFEFGRESEFVKDDINADFYNALLYRVMENGKCVVEEGYRASKGIELAIEELNNLDSGNEKAILLLSSGTELDDTSEAVQLAKKHNISITTVDVGKKKELSSILKSMAAETGGTYFDISTYNFNNYEDLCEIAMNAVKSFRRKGMKDTDGDGLFDIYELYGVKASNGTIIKTDYKKADTDGDGLTDVEELNLKENAESGEIVAYACSDPRYKDTDGDGLMDYEDPFPQKKMDKNFIYVSSLNYFPEFHEIYKKIKDDYWARINGSGDYELASSFNINEIKDIKKRARLQANLTKVTMMSGQLLEYYLDGKGKRYDFSATTFIKESANAKFNYDKNIRRLMKVCKKLVRKGEKRYIATSRTPKTKFTGTNYENITVGHFPLGAIVEFEKFTSLGSANAGMVCECSYDGKWYTVSGIYYLMDYYDWDVDNDKPIGIVSASELYKLNLTGDAQNFEVRGKKTFAFHFK